MPQREIAIQPEDLDRLFLERANTGDVEGVVALYEPNAVLAFPEGQVTVGRENIRRVYEQSIAAGQKFQGIVLKALVKGDIAMTSTALPGNATVEIARRQSDGSWLWAIDNPSVI